MKGMDCFQVVICNKLKGTMVQMAGDVCKCLSVLQLLLMMFQWRTWMMTTDTNKDTVTGRFWLLSLRIFFPFHTSFT